MSVEASSWVWKFSNSRGSARLLLLRIANNADENGCNSWHTVKAMARATKMSERQVSRAARQLQALGEVAVQFKAGPFDANVYSLPLMGDRMSPPPPAGSPESAAHVGGGGDNLSPGVVTNMSQGGDILSGAIRKERPITSKTLTPPTPLFQRGAVNQKRLTRAERRAQAEAERGPCAIHPESGLTQWGTCWGCYTAKYSSDSETA
jgi:hypothetical protein